MTRRARFRGRASAAGASTGGGGGGGTGSSRGAGFGGLFRRASRVRRLRRITDGLADLTQHSGVGARRECHPLHLVECGLVSVQRHSQLVLERIVVLRLSAKQLQRRLHGIDRTLGSHF